MTYEGEEVTQQDANESGESSAAPETSQSQNQEASASEQSAASSQSQPQSVPFHEDPRVRDYIERQVAKQTQTYEQRLAEMQKQFSKPAEAKQSHPFVEKLKSIDPTYGEWAGNMEQLKEQVAQFQQWQQEQQRQVVVQQYESSVDKLHSEYKVPKEWQEDIREKLDLMAMRNPNLGLKDLPDAYRQIHEKYKGRMEALSRAQRASYVTDKSKDAATPTSQPKGKAAPNKDKSAPFTDREEMYAAIAKKAASRSRAESDI